DAGEETVADLSLPGDILGTAPYMAPEQAGGRTADIDERTDVYGLGAVLYVILTGARPFHAPTTRQILQQVVRDQPPPPRSVVASPPPALEAICRKAMAKYRAVRYQTAAELAAEVRNWLADEPVAAYPEPWAVRAGRWARQHRTALTAAAALL